MDPKVLIVYNTCGIHGRDLSETYARHLRSLVQQDLPNKRIVVSDCCSTDSSRHNLMQAMGDSVSYSLIDDELPVTLTYNTTVLRCVEAFGDFDYFLYIESGISLVDRPGYLRSLLDAMAKQPEFGVVLGLVDYDNALPEFAPDLSAAGDILPIPYDKAINLHVAAFTADYAHFWDHKLLPDIFFNNGTEAAFPYMCASVRKKLGAFTKEFVSHMGVFELPNRIYPSYPPHIPMSGGEGFAELYARGKQFGLGWDMLVGFCELRSDRSKFDENGYVKDNGEFYLFLDEHLFLPEERVHYNTVPGCLIK